MHGDRRLRARRWVMGLLGTSIVLGCAGRPDEDAAVYVTVVNRATVPIRHGRLCEEDGTSVTAFLGVLDPRHAKRFRIVPGSASDYHLEFVKNGDVLKTRPLSSGTGCGAVSAKLVVFDDSLALRD